MIAIAQDGAQLGEFSVEQIRAMLSSGKLSGSALYWQQGMTEWRPISEMPNLYSESAVGVAISPKQRAFLDYHGITYLPTTTRSQASELIEGAINNSAYRDSKWNTFKHLVRSDLYPKPLIPLTQRDKLKMAQLRLADAEAKYAQLRTAYPHGEPEWVENAKSKVDELREEVSSLKLEVADKSASSDEIADEIDRFLESWREGDYEFTSQSVERFAHVVKSPTKTHIKAMRKWLAYEAGLKLSDLSLDQFLCLYVEKFPDVVKIPFKGNRFPNFAVGKTFREQQRIDGLDQQSSVQAPSRLKKGCLGIVMAVAAPLAALFMWGAVVLLR